MTLETNAPIRLAIREMRQKFLVASRKGTVGKVREMDPARLLNTDAYELREEFLTFCDEVKPEHFDRLVPTTRFWQEIRDRKGTPLAREKCRRYARLLAAIRKRYERSRGHLPVIVTRVSGGTAKYSWRLDGTHRISILRYLGYERVYVITVTEEEYSQFALAWFCEQPGRKLVEREMRAYEKWYQAIEVLPNLWTRPHRDSKEGFLLGVLRYADLAGRCVLDVGCNDGLYSFAASVRGARRVLGIDKRPKTIEQAEFVRAIWGVTQPSTRAALFEVADIRKRPEVLEGKDTVIAACVLYHLAEGLPAFMRALAASKVDLVIVQGNLGRRVKCSDVELKTTPGGPQLVSKETPARLIFDLPRIQQLFALYGFESREMRDGAYPVVTLVR